MKIMGIYVITGPNNKLYVGRSVDIYQRWSKHKSLLRRKQSRCRKLQNAWTKYGEDAFTFRIIEIVHDGRMIEANGKSKLVNREQFWIDTLFTLCDETMVYNISRIAGANGGYPKSEETRRKISEALTGRKHQDRRKPAPFSDEHRRNMGAVRRGKKMPPRSEEYKEKQRITRLGRKASEETKRKQSASMMGKTHTVSEETREKLRQHNLGNKHTEETKQKISESLIGNTNTKGRILSEDHRRSISEGLKRHYQSDKAEATKKSISESLKKTLSNKKKL